MVEVCKAWTAVLRRRPGQRRSRADSGRSRDHKESRGPTLERGRTERSHDQMVAGLGPIYLPKRLQPTSVGRLRRSATRPRAPRSKAIAAIPDEASISGAEIVPWLPPLSLPLLPLPLPLPADACVTAPRARAEAIPSAPMIRRSNIFSTHPQVRGPYPLRDT